jgi:hypothetical protein
MVNKALADPVMAQSDLMLACCRVLSLYELFRRVPTAGPVPISEKERGSQAADWRNHVQGTCRLLQLRGRQKHVDAVGSQLYDGVRLAAVM